MLPCDHPDREHLELCRGLALSLLFLLKQIVDVFKESLQSPKYDYIARFDERQLVVYEGSKKSLKTTQKTF